MQCYKFAAADRKTCPSCNAEIVRKKWRIGKSRDTMPRTLQSFDKPILLVGAQYSCKNGHKFLSYSKVISELFPSKECIPFVLGYRTAFTRDFFNNFANHLAHGTSFLTLEGLTRDSHQSLFAATESQFWANAEMNCPSYQTSSPADECPTVVTDTEAIISSVRSWIMKCCPSKHIIHDCFVNWFMAYETYFREELASTSVQECISFDHTFKLASNIGYWRSDGKWIVQYDSAFFVLNERGEIVTWRLTKGQSFSNVEPQLQQLKNRLLKHGKAVREVHIDNCCTLRNKVQQLFGPETKVYLDLFHAEARFIRTISKKHSHYNSCVRDFRLVFRQRDDLGDKRFKPTADSQTMLKNINAFEEKWCNVRDTLQNRLFTEKSIQELSALRVHIEKGCLSQIQPHRGTNRNEALHRYLNHYFQVPKMGVDVAYALLMTLLVIYNHKQRSKQDISHTSAVSNFQVSTVLHSKHSCLQSLNIPNSLPTGGSVVNPTDEVFGLPVNSCFHKTWANEKLSTHAEVVQQLSATADEMADVDGPLTTHCILQILTKATYLEKVTHTMKEMFKSSPLFNYEHAPFMSSILALLNRKEYDPERQPYSEHCERLDSRLAVGGFERVCVSGDGNCFFRACAVQLCELASKSKECKDLLCRLGIRDGAPHDQVHQDLRKIVVSEWMENPQRYQPFLTNSTVCEIAPVFLQVGEFNHDLGNTMPLAMANATGIPIIIISSLENHGIFRVDPENITVSEAMLLSYNQYGLGHYDAIKPINLPTSTTVPQHCRCGINKKSSTGVGCTNVIGQYSTRCKCYKSGQPCTVVCRCINCSNPHGSRSAATNPPTLKSRVRHKEELRPPKPVCQFMEIKGEALQTGKWTLFEFHVLQEIISFHIENDINVNPEDLYTSYQQIFEFVQGADSLHIPLGIKSLKQITGKFQQHLNSLEVFRTIFAQQVAYNVKNAPQ